MNLSRDALPALLVLLWPLGILVDASSLSLSSLSSSLSSSYRFHTRTAAAFSIGSCSQPLSLRSTRNPASLQCRSLSRSSIVGIGVGFGFGVNDNDNHDDNDIAVVAGFGMVGLNCLSQSRTRRTRRTTKTTTSTSSLGMAGGEGGESEWAKALREASGDAPGSFEKEMAQKLGMPAAGGGGGGAATAAGGKMKGLAGRTTDVNPKLTANANLITWLEKEGNVYLRDESSWGEAPHPMAISTETVDELTNESSGRGLLARRNINEGDELLIIPMSLCLTKKSAREALGKDALPRDINDYLAIACQLIHERYVLNEKSFWKPYLDVLPQVDEVNPTFTWSDEDLSFLEGSPVVPATKSLKNKLRREYDTLLGNPNTGLCDTYPHRFPRDKFTFEAWIWAFTMLFSRAIRLRNLRDGEALAMVPYADLINHSPFSQAYVDARETGDWLFKTGEEEVILYADRGYRKMEQIYISYGPKSNADLLLLYGFALERNPYNSVDVTVRIDVEPSPSPSSSSSSSSDGSSIDSNNENDDENENVDTDPLAAEKIAFLEKVGRSNTADFPCYADRYPVEMLEYLRLMQMTTEDTRGRPLNEFDYTRTISAANEASVLGSVVNAVKMQLLKYPTTEEQDADIIRDKGLFRLLNYNQRMAIRHRRNEKRLLKRTVAALEKQIRRKGLDRTDLKRADGSTLGEDLPGQVVGGGRNKRTALEDRLEKMGLPVDLK